MNKQIIYKNFIQKKHLNKNSNKLNKDYRNNLKNIISELENVKNTFHSLSKNFEINFKNKDIKKFRKYNSIIVIGMGGSILGAEAIYNFLEKKIKKNFIFINNIDEIKLLKIKKNINLNQALFIVISKSGNTIETLSNFSFLKVIKKNKKNIIIISEKSDNPLYQLSKK